MSKNIPVEETIALIQRGDVAVVSGYGTKGVLEKLLARLENRFTETNEPADLTMMSAGEIGDGGDRGLNRLDMKGC